MCDSAQSDLWAKSNIATFGVSLYSNKKRAAMNAPKHLVPLMISLLGAVCGPTEGFAGPLLGSADPYAVLAGTLVSASGDGANIIGSVGAANSAISGPMVITNGTQNNAGGSAALGDANAAAAFLRGIPATQDLTGADLGGRILKAGAYKFKTTAGLNGTLTLDAQTNDNAVFIFEIGTDLTTGSDAKVSVVNGGPHDGVYWLVGSQATLGDNTVFQGNIIAGTAVVLDPSAQIQCGRAIANTAVTMAGKTTANPTNLVSTNGIPAGCVGGFAGGYELSNGVIALVDSGRFTGVSEGEGVSLVGGPVSGDAVSIPEPATLALVGIAFAGIGLSRHRRIRCRGAAAA